jgi:topoisomerase-4 subunit A
MGNTVTKYPVKKIVLKSKGVSTLAGRKIWYDDVLKRLNVDGRGKFLGAFDGEDKILTVMSNGISELVSFDLSNHFDDKMILIEKYDPEKVYSVVHYEGKAKNYFIKRFKFENTAIGKQASIISDEPGSKLVLISGASQPVVKVDQLKGKTLVPETVEINLADAIDVKGMRAQGNRLSQFEIQTVELLTEHDDAADVPDPVAEVPLEEVVKEEKEEIEAEQEISAEPELQELAETATEPEPEPEPEAKPAKKIEFEITNPNDVEIDDKGQLGLF